MLVERSGIQMEHNNAIEAAYSYGVIDEHITIDSSLLLTREWMAYTLVNLTGMDDPYNGEIRDIEDCQFADEVRCSIPLIPLQNDMFYPLKEVEKQEALSILDQAVSICNQRVISRTLTDVQENRDISLKKLEYPPTVNEDGLLKSQEGLQEEDVICWYDEEGYPNYGKIVKDDTYEGYRLQEMDLFSLYDSVHLSGSTSVDFSKVQIMDGNGDIIHQAQDDVTSPMAISSYTSSFDIQEWKVTLNATSTGLKAEVSKEMLNGSKAYANVRVSGLRFDYQWLSEKQSVKDVYFKVAFNSEENFGVRHTSYKKLYGDFSKVDPGDFASTVKNFFQDADHCVQKTLTLATVTVPIPSAPGISLQMKVELNIYVSGRIEISMSQAHTLGCEIRNGTTRLIQKMDPKHTEDIRATAKLTSGLRFALRMSGFELCNAALNAGVETSLTTDLHLYDKDGSHTVVQTDLPTDVADELSEGNGNVLVCADLDAHLIGEVDLNSQSSVLGKLGMNRTVTIFSVKNASLLPSGMRHLENFHFVSACTRKGSTSVIVNDAPKVTGKITLERYAYAIGINGYRTIAVTGLPEGYTKEDLVYESADAKIAMVSVNGRVTGKAVGSTEITISTKDGKHTAFVSILVKTS